MAQKNFPPPTFTLSRREPNSFLPLKKQKDNKIVPNLYTFVIFYKCAARYFVLLSGGCFNKIIFSLIPSVYTFGLRSKHNKKIYD
jgi:hypothetical protein